MTKSWIIWSLVLCTGLIEEVWTQQNLKQTVGSEATECDIKGQLLFCDYKNSQQDVFMEPLVQREGIIKVYLYNIIKLHLDESVCVNVTLHNVKEMVLKGETQSECQRFELTAKKSNMDKIPQNVNRLYLEECEVNYLKSYSELSKLNIISSNIKELDLSKSLANDTTAVIQGSQIDSLQGFVVDFGSTLLVQKSNIKSIKLNGLKIRNGDIIMKESNVNSSKGSVTVAPGGSFKVGNFQGELTITAAYDHSENVNESSRTNQCPAETCKESKLFVVLFSICFVLLICSWIGFAVYLNFRDEILKVIGRSPANPEGSPDIKTVESPLNENRTETHTKETQVKEIDLSTKSKSNEDEINRERVKQIAEQARSAKSYYDSEKGKYESEITPIDKEDSDTDKKESDVLISKKKIITKDKIAKAVAYLDELRAIEKTNLKLLNQTLLKEAPDPLNIEQGYGHLLQNSFSDINQRMTNILEDPIKAPSPEKKKWYKNTPKGLNKDNDKVKKNKNETSLARNDIESRIQNEIADLQLEIQNKYIKEKENHIIYLNTLITPTDIEQTGS